MKRGGEGKEGLGWGSPWLSSPCASWEHLLNTRLCAQRGFLCNRPRIPFLSRKLRPGEGEEDVQGHANPGFEPRIRTQLCTVLGGREPHLTVGGEGRMEVHTCLRLAVFPGPFLPPQGASSSHALKSWG